jgi:Fe2+ or Zn2+ uptake regulation protein
LSSCDTTAIEAAAKNRGYTQLTHVLEIYGLCPTCTHG